MISETSSALIASAQNQNGNEHHEPSAIVFSVDQMTRSAFEALREWSGPSADTLDELDNHPVEPIDTPDEIAANLMVSVNSTPSVSLAVISNSAIPTSLETTAITSQSSSTVSPLKQNAPSMISKTSIETDLLPLHVVTQAAPTAASLPPPSPTTLFDESLDFGEQDLASKHSAISPIPWGNFDDNTPEQEQPASPPQVSPTLANAPKPPASPPQTASAHPNTPPTEPREVHSDKEVPKHRLPPYRKRSADSYARKQGEGNSLLPPKTIDLLERITKTAGKLTKTARGNILSSMRHVDQCSSYEKLSLRQKQILYGCFEKIKKDAATMASIFFGISLPNLEKLHIQFIDKLSSPDNDLKPIIDIFEKKYEELKAKEKKVRSQTKT